MYLYCNNIQNTEIYIEDGKRNHVIRVKVIHYNTLICNIFFLFKPYNQCKINILSL